MKNGAIGSRPGAMKRLAILVAAFLAMASPVAAGATPEFNSAVKIRSDRNGDPPPMWRNYYPHFKGTVRSGKAACEGHRDVDLYRKGPGKDLLVGGDRTNSKGKWEIVLDKPGENDYYARVLLREIGAGDCLADRSPVFHHDGFS